MNRQPITVQLGLCDHPATATTMERRRSSPITAQLPALLGLVDMSDPSQPPPYGSTDSPMNDLTEEERIALASTHHSSGNTLFLSGHYTPALDAYTLALRLLPPCHPRVPLLHSNASACHLHLDDYVAARRHAELAVELRPTWGKAKVRLLKAHEGLAGGWRELEELEGGCTRVLGDGEVELTERERADVEGIRKRVKRRLEAMERGEVEGVVKGLEGVRVGEEGVDE